MDSGLHNPCNVCRLYTRRSAPEFPYARPLSAGSDDQAVQHPKCFDNHYKNMDPIARRVALRWAYKYVPKETKQRKVEKIRELIKQHTGLSKSQAEAIADAYVRGRNIEQLALQKSWPVEHGKIKGPTGELALDMLPVE